MTTKKNESKPRLGFKPGDRFEIQVDPYEEPFIFAVSLRAYERLQRAEKKNYNVICYNFLRETCEDFGSRLEPLLDQKSEEFDMTLQATLLAEVAHAIGLDREATVKKL